MFDRSATSSIPFPISASLSPSDAEAILLDLASVFGRDAAAAAATDVADGASPEGPSLPNVEAKYRTLVEQLPAVVFMAYLDRGIGEAYVSPRIEEVLGFTQAEWLEDPVRWYNQIHPDDQGRWSVEAAEMFLTGKPLRSAYRVRARDGRVIWFQCEAKMIRRDDGRPWFIHGVAFDVTELKRTERALEVEHTLLAAILETVGALVVLLNPAGRIVRFNRTCESLSGYSSNEVRGKFFADLFLDPEEAARFAATLRSLRAKRGRRGYESDWITRDGTRRRIEWSTRVLRTTKPHRAFVIATGIDITERKHTEREVLEISAREQRQIGQDLHDGLGQHLTGIAFMSKVLEQKLRERGVAEAGDAAKIVRLVNEAINRTRELARGLLPVVSEEDGLATALRRWTSEIEDVFRMPCDFECAVPVPIADVSMATHLYHIAQEAVSNAIKHASASRIVVSLTRGAAGGSLTIEDDGIGMSHPTEKPSGLGLRTMRYRASMIGGSLNVRRALSGGTVVHCQFPLRD